jgi:hypothetical protein
MRFFEKLFSRSEEEPPITNNGEFWEWFQSKEKEFYNILKSHDHVEERFFNPLSSKLNELRSGYWFLAGMLNDYRAELVLTADGVVENIAFVETLVDDAPHLPGWKITALKPAADIQHISIQLGDFVFDKSNLAFYSNEDTRYPDEIDLSIVYSGFKEEFRDVITKGIFIFLDNCLGELRTVTVIDAIEIAGEDDSKQVPIPIEKLNDFLIWREKEFLEKYDGVRRHTQDDEFASLSGELENGNPIIAVINVNLLEWDRKASHPWVMVVTMGYQGNESGMPDNETMDMLALVEDEILKELKDFDGYLNVGRSTGNHHREVFFACRDFRLPSMVLDEARKKYEARHKITFEIYKDKYWRTFNKFKIPG